MKTRSLLPKRTYWMVLLLLAAGGPSRAYFTPLDLNLMPGPRYDIDASRSNRVPLGSVLWKRNWELKRLPGVAVSYVVSRVYKICDSFFFTRSSRRADFDYWWNGSVDYFDYLLKVKREYFDLSNHFYFIFLKYRCSKTINYIKIIPNLFRSDRSGLWSIAANSVSYYFGHSLSSMPLIRRVYGGP